MDSSTLTLLDTIFNKISGDDEKKISKLKVVASPLIADGDITQDELDEFISFSKIRYDKIVIHLVNKNTTKKTEETIQLLYYYFKKLSHTDKEILNYFNVLKEHVFSSNIIHIIDKEVYKILSKSDDKEVSTEASLKYIKITREENSARNTVYGDGDDGYGYSDSCGSSWRSNSYRSSC